MKINGIDTSKGGTTNAFIDALTAKGYEVTKADAPNANFQCYNATITDKSGYNTITIFFGGCDAAHITARVDKVNGTYKWYYGKTIAQMLAVVRQCMEGYDWTKPTKAEAIEAMDDDAEDPSVTLDEFIAKAQEIDNMKEEDTMSNTTKTTQKGLTYEQFQKLAMKHYNHGGDDFVECWDEKMFNDYVNEFGPVTVRKALEMFGFMDEVDTEERKAAEFFSGMSNTTTTENEKEDTTMKTTNPTTATLNMKDGTVRFELNGITYKYTIESKRYAKTTPDGKTVRIGKAEYDTNWATYEQAILDNQPSHVEVENDLDKPAVLNENGLVDCSKCNRDKCVHRDCMRRNPRNVGGLGECPRLDNGIVSEAQKVAEETGMELAEAELAVNVQNEQKKARKARKSKDIAYEGNGVTLTAKQVDFLGHLSDTCFWENGADSTAWIDVLCDEIRGQFEGKPMTVGAMVSTLCEKGLGYRAVDKLTDMVTGKGRKATYFGLTELGQKIYTELGLE